MIAHDWKSIAARGRSVPPPPSGPREAYVVDLVNRAPIFVPVGASVLSAMERAREADVHYLVVLREEDVVGICCRCDLASARTTDTVGDVMTAPALVIDDQASGLAAAEMMRSGGVGCLPIVDWAGHVKGVVTLSDLVRAGLVPADAIPVCSACGARHGILVCEANQVSFCSTCLQQSMAPRRAGDDLYFTLGGGD